jgi:hypothetical protein
LIFGIIDMGWIAFNYAQLYNAFREGVRFGSVNGLSGGTLAQYVDCARIRQQVTSHAGLSGIKDTNITIYYDDGRTISGAVSSNPPEMVGTCPVGGTGTFVANSSYLAEDGTTRSPVEVQNGDRIVIVVDINVQFLTPMIKSFAKNGISMHIDSARSIFPEALAS